MNFDKHLFVSYAHVDDMMTPGDDQGWVTRFHKYLESYLSQSIGEPARIWRDDRLRGNDIFANEIVKQFPQTAVLLSILSPRYIDSEWCLREVDEFCRTAELNGGLTVDDKARVIRIMLRGIPAERREQLPHVLKDALGYEFFQWTDGGHELPLDPAFGTGEAYRRQIYFLAEDIADLINRLKQADVGKSKIPKDQKPAIYLAETSYDVREEREKIRGDLRAHGYTVVPDQLARMPDLESEYISEVSRLLDQCKMSIHIIGSVWGKAPDGPSLKSAVQGIQVLDSDLGVEGGGGGVLRIDRSDDSGDRRFAVAGQRGANREGKGLCQGEALQFHVEMVIDLRISLQGQLLDCGVSVFEGDDADGEIG